MVILIPVKPCGQICVMVAYQWKIKRRTRHVKPKLVVICDISTSVRYCTEFLLTLLYELQDQVASTNSFVFIADMVDISMEFKEHEPQEAVNKVMMDNLKETLPPTKHE